MHGITRRFFGPAMAALLGLALARAAVGSARAQAPAAAGEVTKLDKPGGRVTLKHGGIQSLDMPPMVMTFRVADARLLDALAVGDRVRFTAERLNGQFTLTSVSKVP